MTEYEPHLGLVEKSFEISDSFRQSVKIVAIAVSHFNAFENPTAADRNHLTSIIEDFNYHQKYCAVKGECETPTELISLWKENYAIPQIKLVRHSANRKLVIAFYTSYLKFNDFYETHKDAFPQYLELKQVLSTYCHHLFDSILTSPKGDPLADYRLLITQSSPNK